MARVDVYRVLLIRSGATAWDETEHLSGLADLPICEAGLARFVIDPGTVVENEPRSVLSANDQASVQSAGLVAKALGCKVKACSGLRDVDLGLWQGLRMDEIRERSPKVYKQWCDDPLSLKPPEGEPLRVAQERLIDEMIRAIERAARGAKSHTPVVAVVLRPVAMALVRAKLLDDPGLVCWPQIVSGPAFEWHRIPHERVDLLRAPVSSGV
ncbi:MAG: histidine phosphatase family protein [Phycisphaerales bacterium]|nr:histidine phosphatase family protein [Phycisphaerales bacterium]